MAAPDIPEPVLRFIAGNIDTVPQLEALLLIWETQPHSWGCAELAARIYVGFAEASYIAATLQRRGFLSADESTPPRYRYNQLWDESGVMAQVADSYRRHLVPIATFIHSKASPAVREFARAFDLKKER